MQYPRRVKKACTTAPCAFCLNVDSMTWRVTLKYIQPVQWHGAECATQAIAAKDPKQMRKIK